MARTSTARELLLDVAERLFAERGIDGVSLREIGASAGQRNNSAAQYHFGTRDGLVDAIFERRMVPVDVARRSMVEQLEADGRSGDVRALCEAFVVPLATALASGDGPSWYGRFLAQVAFHTEFAAQARRHPAATHGVRQVLRHLDRTLVDAGLPSPVREQRLELAVSLALHALADRERAMHERRLPRRQTALIVPGVVDAMVAVLTAPMSDAVRAELDR